VNPEKIMKQVTPGAQHALLVKRADGVVGLFFTREPMNWLGVLSQHIEIEEAECRPSPASPRIVSHLRARFAHAHIPNESYPWYLIDFPQAVEALGDFDLATGELLDALKPDAEVLVLPDRQRGRVIGFSRCGRVIVRLHTTRLISNLVLALRENIKPVLRVPALSGPREG
jgi:hypothetical protein